MSRVNRYVSSASLVLLILYLLGVSLISVFPFFQLAFGSCLPLQRHSILIDFSLLFFVIFGFSKAGVNLSIWSRLALSPTERKFFPSRFLHSVSSLTRYFNTDIRDRCSNFIRYSTSINTTIRRRNVLQKDVL